MQQLAGAAGGAVLISASTIGSSAADAGQLSVAVTVSAGQAAFMTGGILALAGLIGTLLIGRRRRADRSEPA
ncbi:hypothetical protein EDF36_2468 [Rathayibacter sp. PhB152]|nr:hypothetical protein EDF36_2468 [Rathayibacter sp. PhB152]